MRQKQFRKLVRYEHGLMSFPFNPKEKNQNLNLRLLASPMLKVFI